MKITIKDSGGTTRDYSSYYDRTREAFTFQETYDPQSGRTKTGTLKLFNVDGSFVVPLEDQEIKVYRDVAGTDLIFGGVISKVNKSAISRTDTTWFISYDLKLSGYDPYTLQFRQIIDYDRISIKSGQIIKDIIAAYAPWIDTTNVEVATSPVIKKVHIERRNISEIIQAIVEKTQWTFYVNDSAQAYFNQQSALTLNWALTEGTTPDYFKEFDFESLQPESNVEQNVNDITAIGGLARSSKVVEVFTFNGQEGSRGLAYNPFGLENSIQIFDAHDDNTIDTTKWYENDAGNKVTESSGRLQINSGVSNTSILVSKDSFSRDDNSEVRYAEVQITSFASGKLTVGVHNGTQATTITNFLHALEFDQASGNLRTREGSTVTTFGSIPIGVGVYSVRIRVKSSGGAIYYIQGGRTGTPIEYGELGSKTWTKVTETSADTTAFLAIAMYCDTAIGATIIRSKVSKDIDVKVELLNGGKLGTAAAVGADTILQCGVQKALDFETDCFIGTQNDQSTIEFFTDDLPLGSVRITYWVSDAVRERVYDATAKTTVDGRSSLTGDDGTRSEFIDIGNFIFDSQDARDLLVSLLNASSTLHYRGSFTTDTLRLSKLIPVGENPQAGKLLTISLVNTYGINGNELITSVQGTDVGGQIVQYDIQFGLGNADFNKLLLKLKNSLDNSIVDDSQDAVLPVDAEDKTTAGTARIVSPEFSSAVYNATGVAIAWAAVAGATAYEVRDNLYRGQGQGGSLVYQNSGATSYSILAATIISTHKKRSFKFYVWAINGTQYSKYPLVITVENPQPVPQPIRDLYNPNGLTITTKFAPEVEADITASGRNLQIATDRSFSSIVSNTFQLKTLEGVDFVGNADTVYYVRYSLYDDYTAGLADPLFSGIREIKTGAADFSGTKQFVNNTAPDNATTSLAVTSSRTPGGEGYVTYTFNYTQGTNVATHFALVFKIGGGTPTINDPSVLVPARSGTGITFSIPLPVNALTSFALIPIAVTRGGSSAIGSYQTIVNQILGGDAVNSHINGIGSGFVFIADDGGSEGVKMYKTCEFRDASGNIGGSIAASSSDLLIHTIDTVLDLLAETSLGVLKNIRLGGTVIPYPSGTPTIGTSGSPWSEIRGTSIYRSGTEIGSLFAAISHSHAKGDLPAAVAYEDENNTFTGTNDFSSGSGKIIIRSTSGASQPSMSEGEVAVWLDTNISKFKFLFKSAGVIYEWTQD